MSKRSKAPSHRRVIHFTQREKATDAQGNKTKLQAAFGFKHFNSELNTRAKHFCEGKFGGGYQIY